MKCVAVKTVNALPSFVSAAPLKDVARALMAAVATVAALCPPTCICLSLINIFLQNRGIMNT